MGPWVWVLIPLAATVAALFVYTVMRARADVVLARERQAMAELRGALEAQKEAMEGRLREVEETTRRKAMDEFLADVRVEERHYVRENRLLFVTRKSLVVQERVYFRNIPLSNWIEQERVIEEGADIEKVARTMSLLDGLTAEPSRKLLR